MRPTSIHLLAGSLLLASACATGGGEIDLRPGEGAAPTTRQVELLDREGRRVGTATLAQGPGGVRIQALVSGLEPGPHGFHIHQTGRCEAPQFTSAGGHFNPADRSHGFLDPAGPHVGDLPNLQANEQGVAQYDFTTRRAALTRESLLRPGGTALVIHARPDDYLTNPSGSAGDRVACGVIAPA